MTQLLGTLWGISVGPGDAEWLTLKALRRLQLVPVVACPQDRRGQLGMAYRIVQEYLSSEQTIVGLKLPFVQEPTVLNEAWQQATTDLLHYLEAGQDVAFIAEGDVSFYSTFTHLARTLHTRSPNIEISAIPGVCSPLAAAAALHMPLSTWDERIAVLPALYRMEELSQALDWAEVVVLMKVASVFGDVWRLLQERNLLQHTSLVEWVGWEKQAVHPTLERLEGYLPHYFSIAIVRSQPIHFGRPK